MSAAMLLVLSAWAYAEPDGVPAPAAEVRRLIRQLDANELVARETAEKQLIELGPPALENLPDDSERMSAEVKQRLTRVRQTLRRARAENFLLGTRVTLEVDEQPLASILSEIEQQTENTLVDFREQMGQEIGGQKLSLHVADQPFWPALDALLDDAGLTVYGYSGEPGIALISAPEGASPRAAGACYVGAFRIEGMQIEAHRELRGARDAGLMLGLEIAWEPRLKPIGIKQRMSDVVAVDEQGRTLENAAPEAEIEALLNPGAMLAELSTPLVPPPRTSQEIASLRGKLQVLLPGGVESFRFEKLSGARRVEQRKGGVLVTLDETRKNNELWEVRVRVTFDAATGALESHRGWVFDNEAYLLSPRNKVLVYDGFQTTLQTEDEVGLAYLFDLPEGLDGYTFVYKTPVVVLNLPIEYELQHLPLP